MSQYGYDGMPVAWNVSCKPDAHLVNIMLERAIRSLPQDAHPILHSDRGGHYRWPGWIKRIDDAGLTRRFSLQGILREDEEQDVLWSFVTRFHAGEFYSAN